MPSLRSRSSSATQTATSCSKMPADHVDSTQPGRRREALRKATLIRVHEGRRCPPRSRHQLKAPNFGRLDARRKIHPTGSHLGRGLYRLLPRRFSNGSFGGVARLSPLATRGIRHLWPVKSPTTGSRSVPSTTKKSLRTTRAKMRPLEL